MSVSAARSDGDTVDPRAAAGPPETRLTGQCARTTSKNFAERLQRTIPYSRRVCGERQPTADGTAAIITNYNNNRLQ